MQVLATIGVILAFVVISLKRLENEEMAKGKCDL